MDMSCLACLWALECIDVCIMLAMNTCLDVMSGSTEKGVPRWIRPAWSITWTSKLILGCSPRHAFLELIEVCSRIEVITLLNLGVLVLVLWRQHHPAWCRWSCSAICRCLEDILHNLDHPMTFACALSWDFHNPTNWPNRGWGHSRPRAFSLIW